MGFLGHTASTFHLKRIRLHLCTVSAEGQAIKTRRRPICSLRPSVGIVAERETAPAPKQRNLPHLEVLLVLKVEAFLHDLHHSALKVS